ncbi:peptidoglycan-binding protein [Methylobacterium currus]|uniref:Peptidoglycan-binding protein n=1 Tax=Methylobacterium currus TaxID=2051553 RepID=A0A2R4WPU2_9HYPH|nr:peptidoglycan-binding domain-containing protein [Methylobacterium currus]AWB23563.1 peptidoglycan-binding protein [Methylobacterium currus]UHC16780.1 peptidoglycan-binding protein [Methylobacterium currus]
MSEAPARKPVEATARRHDSDVALTAEARPAPRPRPAARAPRAPRSAPRPAGPLDRLRLRADRILRHPAGIVGGLLALGAVAAVAANALSFQTGRHPAPLFAKAPPLPGLAPAGEAAPTATAKAEAPRSTGDAGPREAAARPKPDGIGALIRGEDHGTASVTPKAAPAKAVAAKAAPAKEAPARDAAGKDTAGKDTAGKPAPVREARAAEPVKASALHAAPAPGAKPDKAVAYAQRALIKLGYGPLTVDGIAGPTTRAALARFERERRLPGASVARRTLQELEARSGLKPE